MNPLSRTLAALASAVGFYGGDGIHLTKLKPGSATARDVRIDPEMPGNRAWFQVPFGLSGFVTGTSRRARNRPADGAGSAAGPGWIKRGLPVDACTTQC